jgi:hypothetical protein
MSETIAERNGVRVTASDKLNESDSNIQEAIAVAEAYDEMPQAIERISPSIGQRHATVWVSMKRVESNTATRIPNLTPTGYEVYETSIIGAWDNDEPARTIAVDVKKTDA